jgi:hypothetical protein
VIPDLEATLIDGAARQLDRQVGSGSEEIARFALTTFSAFLLLEKVNSLAIECDGAE